MKKVSFLTVLGIMPKVSTLMMPLKAEAWITVLQKHRRWGGKVGIYGDRGTMTCVNVPQSGSKGYEDRDVKTFTSWGGDYLKVKIIKN
jgi:hypothetical protein